MHSSSLFRHWRIHTQRERGQPQTSRINDTRAAEVEVEPGKAKEQELMHLDTAKDDKSHKTQNESPNHVQDAMREDDELSGGRHESQVHPKIDDIPGSGQDVHFQVNRGFHHGNSRASGSIWP